MNPDEELLEPDDSRIVRAPDEPPLKTEYTQDSVLDLATVLTDKIENETGRSFTESEHAYLAINIGEWLFNVANINIID